MKHDPNIEPIHCVAAIQRLVEVRLAWGLTIKTVSQRIGCHKDRLSKWENGDDLPSMKLFMRWADVLGYRLSIWPKEQK